MKIVTNLIVVYFMDSLSCCYLQGFVLANFVSVGHFVWKKNIANESPI